MRQLVKDVLDLAKVKKVTYADIRIVHRQTEEISVKNGKVDALNQNEDQGFGARVLFQGAWGFAASSKINKAEMEKTLDRAWRIAQVSSRVKEKDVLFPARQRSWKIIGPPRPSIPFPSPRTGLSPSFLNRRKSSAGILR